MLGAEWLVLHHYFEQDDIAPLAKRQRTQLNIDWEEKIHVPAELNTTQIEFWEVP